jgi:tellurite resistance protein
MTHHNTPLKFLMPGWFAIVMGLCGLALAWHRATPMMGEMAGAGALVLGVFAAAVALVLAVASLVRWQRYPKALAEDLNHPVRHVFVAAMPISLLLLATVATVLAGPTWPAKAMWMAGSIWQFAVTVWVLSRWLRPNIGAKDGTPFWPGITPALFIPVVGNVVPPLAGVALGFPEWAAAQFGVGLFLWPVALTLLAVRLAVSGMWPERLLPTTFITVAPPAVIGLGALQLGAPVLLAWVAWGIGLFFLAWSAAVFRRAVSQAFGVPFWAMSFPLAAFSALTLRLAQDASGAFQALSMIVLALASLVIAALALATVKGLRDGSLLAPEPVAALNLAAAPAQPGANG